MTGEISYGFIVSCIRKYNRGLSIKERPKWTTFLTQLELCLSQERSTNAQLKRKQSSRRTWPLPIPDWTGNAVL
ncbi:hypothetical protein AGR9A_Lc50079 [Agrobacterium salinitolerans str. Hayward 0363]|nr:hypothetical protein AGR9A_Lc50079 [Agrobacterium salinitolerans str. Hayward 0363]